LPKLLNFTILLQIRKRCAKDSGNRRFETSMKPTKAIPRAQRYARQVILEGVGRAGQERLEAAKVAVVGCGGLGAPVIQYLAAAGVGHLTLFDDDVVEASNLNRQVLHQEVDLGLRKVKSAADWVGTANGDISVDARAERVTVHNARQVLADHDLTVDCTDGLPVKYLLNDAAVREDSALVHGAVTAMAGQVLFVPGATGPCLRCLFAEVPPPESVPTCQQNGVLGAACGVVGSIMATEALKALLGLGENLAGRLLSVDLNGPRFYPLAIPKNDRCPTCSTAWEIDATDPSDYERARPGGPSKPQP
jgi:adenylyltransferase/sulfurtransferase